MASDDGGLQVHPLRHQTSELELEICHGAALELLEHLVRVRVRVRVRV